MQITGFVEDEAGLPPMTASGGDVPVLLSMSPNSNISSISTQTSGGNVKFLSSLSAPAARPTGFTTTPQPIQAYHPLSPRERKMAEFRESYSPSFLQGMSLHQGGFEMVITCTLISNILKVNIYMENRNKERRAVTNEKQRG